MSGRTETRYVATWMRESEDVVREHAVRATTLADALRQAADLVPAAATEVALYPSQRETQA